MVLPADPPPNLPPAGKRVVLPGGIGVNVLEEGEGPPIVLVHGLPGMAADFRNLSAALVARGRRVIAYDRVGYGHSDLRLDDRFTVAQNAAELESLLGAMELESPTVVGWSYGGVTGMALAERAPDRLGRLVLVGTGGPDSAEARPPEPSLAMRLFYSDAVLRWRTRVPPLGVRLMEVLSDRAFSGGPQPDWWLAGLRANFSRWGTLLTYRGEMMSIGSSLKPAKIRAPTLLIHGDDDRLAPIAIARYLATTIPGATLEEFPGGSHMLPVTHSAELADQIVRFSLSQVSAGTVEIDELRRRLGSHGLGYVVE